MMMVMEYVYV